MKITEMEIKELTIDHWELEGIFTRWARGMAAKLEQERIEEERSLEFPDATYPANIDRSANCLLERCKEDPKEVGEWMTKHFLRLVAQKQREDLDE